MRKLGGGVPLECHMKLMSERKAFSVSIHIQTQLARCLGKNTLRHRRQHSKSNWPFFFTRNNSLICDQLTDGDLGTRYDI